VNCLPGFGHSCFMRPVIHDRDDGVDGFDKGARIRKIHPMMVDQVEINGWDGVVGANECDLLGAGQVTKIEKSELPKGDEKTTRAGIFGGVIRPFALAGTVWIGRRLDPRDSGDVFAIGSENDDTEVWNLNSVSGVNNAARLSFDSRQIRCKIAARNAGVLAIGAVIDELADLDVLDQFRYAADMVDMVVRRKNVINMSDAGVFHRSLNACCTATVTIRPAGIHEQRTTGRRDDQRGLPALDVNRINEQALLSAGLRTAGRLRADEEQRQSTEGESESVETPSPPRVERRSRKKQEALNGNSHCGKCNRLRGNPETRFHGENAR